MRSFTIHIETGKAANLDREQQQLINTIVSKLINYRITFIWHVDSKVLTAVHAVAILRYVNKWCEHKGMVVHNILHAHASSTVTPLFRWCKKTFHISTDEKNKFESDVKHIKRGTYPTGCYFNSCLGKTVYIKRDSTIAICPYEGCNCYLNKITSEQTISAIFDTSAFKEMLLESIASRKYCAEHCEYYGLCKGGCAASSHFKNVSNCTIKASIKNVQLDEADQFEENIQHMANLYKG